MAGVLASLGILDLPDLIALVALGAMIGDNVSYLLGRHLGHTWLVRYGGRVGLDHDRLDRVDSFYDRHGGAAVVFGRYVGFLRALVPFVAGAAGMTYPRFLGYNAVAGITWAFAIVLLGFFVGGSWEVIQRWMGWTGLTAAAVLLLIAWLMFLRHRHLAR